MATIYRKTLKGVEEVALKSFGLSPRLRPYLLIADGKLSDEELQSANAAMPSVEMVMKSLADQGFLEAAGATASASVPNVVSLSEMRVSNGAPRAAAPPPYIPPAAPAYRPPPAPVAAPTEAVLHGSGEFDQIKQNMMRDALHALGPDSTQIIIKIQKCANVNDLFVTMMGVKKIISMYAGDPAAEKFELRYRFLSSL